MSDEGPTITVTRGTKKDAPERTSSADQSRPSSGGSGLPGPGTLVSGVVRGARAAWWAGLGMFAVARDAGANIFGALVEEGKSWEQARREEAKERVRQLRRLANERGTVEGVEKRVREEVDRVLQRIGVPRRSEVEGLRDQIDALGEKIDRLAKAVSEEAEEAQGE